MEENIRILAMVLFGFKEVGGSREVSFITSAIHPNTGKEK